MKTIFVAFAILLPNLLFASSESERSLIEIIEFGESIKVTTKDNFKMYLTNKTNKKKHGICTILFEAIPFEKSFLKSNRSFILDRYETSYSRFGPELVTLYNSNDEDVIKGIEVFRKIKVEKMGSLDKKPYLANVDITLDVIREKCPLLNFEVIEGDLPQI